jgi:hypothetical protein
VGRYEGKPSYTWLCKGCGTYSSASRGYGITVYKHGTTNDPDYNEHVSSEDENHEWFCSAKCAIKGIGRLYGMHEFDPMDE